MAYTTGQEVATYLGLDYASLTADQQALLTLTSDAATAYLDRKTGNPFTPTPVALLGELHHVDGPAVYLNFRPVWSVEAVRARLGYANLAWTLQDPSSYELLQPETGMLLTIPLGDPITAPSLDLLDPLAGWLLSVDYTYGEPCPADLHLAALELAGGTYQRAQAPDLRLYQSVTIGQLSVSVRDMAQIAAASPGVKDVISNYRKVLIA